MPASSLEGFSGPPTTSKLQVGFLVLSSSSLVLVLVLVLVLLFLFLLDCACGGSVRRGGRLARGGKLVRDSWLVGGRLVIRVKDSARMSPNC
jgi:hypothetical protein